MDVYDLFKSLDRQKYKLSFGISYDIAQNRARESSVR